MSGSNGRGIPPASAHHEKYVVSADEEGRQQDKKGTKAGTTYRNRDKGKGNDRMFVKFGKETDSPSFREIIYP